jgi:hypothetical protein
MGEADLFRQFADEAKQGLSLATNEDEKLALAELAAIWTQAVLTSELVFVTNFTRSRCEGGK